MHRRHQPTWLSAEREEMPKSPGAALLKTSKSSLYCKSGPSSVAAVTMQGNAGCLREGQPKRSRSITVTAGMERCGIHTVTVCTSLPAT